MDFQRRPVDEFSLRGHKYTIFIYIIIIIYYRNAPSDATVDVSRLLHCAHINKPVSAAADPHHQKPPLPPPIRFRFNGKQCKLF